MVQYLQLLLLLGPALAQPVSRSPAMGWRSWYAAPAHGLKDPTQAFVEASMDAMADRSRLVDGVPTSLIYPRLSRWALPRMCVKHQNRMQVRLWRCERELP
jgi:hypothetical protein